MRSKTYEKSVSGLYKGNHTHRGARAREPGVLADGDVGKGAGCSRIDEGVQETEHRLASGDELVVDERDNACETGRRRGCTTDESGFTSRYDHEVPSLEGNL
jgi:hypothetical protein